MFKLTSIATCKCPEIGKRVSLSQSSAECRLQHGCEQEHCPLEYEFEPEPVDFRILTARLSPES